jgi:hypothetical protein
MHLKVTFGNELLQTRVPRFMTDDRYDLEDRGEPTIAQIEHWNAVAGKTWAQFHES